MVDMNNHAPHRQSRTAGFSLVELIMLLGILTMVVLPMLMMMDRQNDYLVSSNLEAQSQFYAKKLIDAVDPHMPLAADAYDVPIVASLYGSSYQSGVRYSIWCDPAAKDIDRTTDFTVATGRCSTAGADYSRGPFFERDVTIDDTLNTVRIRVSLYTNQAGGTPSLQVSRDVEIDSYRIDVGRDTNDTTATLGTTGTFESVRYSPNLTVDAHGRVWVPENFVDPAPNYNALPDLYDTVRMGVGRAQGSCTVSPTYTLTTVSNIANGSYNTMTPFNSVRTVTLCGATLNYLDFRFHVLARTTYDLNVYFTSNTAAACTNPGPNFYSNVGCDMADVWVSTWNGAAAVSQPVNSLTTIDSKAETADKNGYGFVKHMTIAIPAGANRLEVMVKNSQIGTITDRQSNIAAIELVKRWDKSD